MLKFIFSLIVINVSLLSFSFAQTKESSVVPKVRLTVSLEKTTWKQNQPAIAKITLENLAEDSKQVVLPAVISFFANASSGPAVGVTMSEGVFYSPVSLTKKYDKKTSCQNDLTAERIEKSKSGGVSISPATENMILKKGESKEYTFDLAGMCWSHVLSSVYPNQNIFSLIKQRDSWGAKTYRIYFQMSFDDGAIELEGTQVPLSKQIQSNEVFIEIN